MINLIGSDWSCRPRILWQALFDFYRENGGSLNNMDNILIDLKNCQDAFHNLFDGEKKFIFSFYSGKSGQTDWIPESRFFQSPEVTAGCCGGDKSILITLTKDAITIEEICLT